MDQGNKPGQYNKVTEHPAMTQAILNYRTSHHLSDLSTSLGRAENNINLCYIINVLVKAETLFHP